MIATQQIEIQNQHIILTNYRAAFWEEEETLFLSDLHVGKAAHFRKHGIAVPTSVMDSDLARLDALIEFFKAKHLIVVGDLFHAGNNHDVALFLEWRLRHFALQIILVQGNHDRISQKIHPKFDIQLVTGALNFHDFTFVHEEIPNLQTDNFIISGHIHPGVLLSPMKKQYVKLPCFVVFKNGLWLPAFSHFTGFQLLTKKNTCQIFALTQQSVIEL